MGKERMKMQENMNPAPEGAQTPADEEAAREAARLSQLKADMLVLIDTVADSSRDVKLIDGDTLFERFAKRASVAEAPEVDELVREAEADIDAVLGRTDGVSANVVKFRSKSEMKAHADEVATQKAQRRVFSRREVIQNLLAGNVASVVKAAEAADAKTEPEGEAREITREYFDEVRLRRLFSGKLGQGDLLPLPSAAFLLVRAHPLGREQSGRAGGRHDPRVEPRLSASGGHRRL